MHITSEKPSWLKAQLDKPRTYLKRTITGVREHRKENSTNSEIEM
jgi:hypothetical protein